MTTISPLHQRIKPHRKSEWVVYAKAPFGGPEAVLAYLSRYIHRVTISNRHLIKLENGVVTFTYKDYRKEGADCHGTMSLPAAEFIRRFLMHVLPKGFHRIRHYGPLANGNRIARARELLGVQPPAMNPVIEAPSVPEGPNATTQPCPCCGGTMIVIEVFEARS